MKESHNSPGLDVVDDEQDEIDEYEDYQYEYATEAASQFIEQQILPQLDDFDYANSHEDYVPGVASFGLYLKLVSRLIEAGFEPQELRQVIDESEAETVTGTVH